jgi:heptosyltransferase-2
MQLHIKTQADGRMILELETDLNQSIASALNRPIVAIYGPTDPAHAPPFSDVATSLFLALECAPCKQRECPLGHHRCMTGISAGMVWEPLKLMISDDR